MDSEMKSCKKHHFVLVHGICQGAWSWYKVKNLLQSLGHQVTALDLAASGLNLKKLSEVNTMLEYSEPLMDFMTTISSEERVILVGHSLGGFSISYAMDKFPGKVSAAVFLAAFMPDTVHRPSYVLEKLSELAPKDAFLDTLQSVEGSKTTKLFGPKFLSTKLCHLSSAQDLTLAGMLIRVGSTFQEDLSTVPNFSEEGYGSVNRIYIVCQEDKAVPANFQRWMIANCPVKEVKEIKDSDHVPMFSRPDEVCHALLEVAEKYA